MNSKILFFLAILLSAAILGPSVKSLVDLDSKSILLIEEEESQETKNDLTQKEFLNVQPGHQLFKILIATDTIFMWAFNEDDKTSLDILLPPPRKIV